MKKTAQILLNQDGRVARIGEDACSLTGLTAEVLAEGPLVEHMLEDHRLRFESELAAIVAREEDHGKVNCTIIGLDGIGRRCTLRMCRLEDDKVHVDLTLATSSKRLEKDEEHSLLDPERLLPVARRISTICRRASTRKDLLTSSLSILSELTRAADSAAVDWTAMKTGRPSAVTGEVFDQQGLKRIFRPGVVARLARGDVIVLESDLPGAGPNSSFVLIPLMGTEVPEGVIILAVDGYAVLAPQEQHSLGILGEIMGLGLRALAANTTPATKPWRGTSDEEAAIALGRLSAGLAHEINNAVTVLRSNAEQSLSGIGGFGQRAQGSLAAKDSLDAVETIRNLTETLKAFAPEETTELEEVDIFKVLGMVVASVRFYAKRGINVSMKGSAQQVLLARCRSHYLTRSLLIIFVELVEAALASGRELNSNIGIEQLKRDIQLTINVTAGALDVPAVLLSQVSQGGVLERHFRRAGALLTHELEDGNLTLRITMPAAKGGTEASIAPEEAARPARRGTILVVDDEPAVVRSIRRLLEPHHDVLAARSGAEALEILKSNPLIDAILLDVLMPGMTGPQVHAEIARSSPASADRVIFVTGGASIPEVSSYLATTNIPLLDKPIDTQRLFAALAELIR